MPLNEYRNKRDFKISPEPSGEKTAPKAPKSSGIYVIQKHRASQLHYDFRLELDGVPATPESLAAVGPEELFREAIAAVKAECGLTDAERKN